MSFADVARSSLKNNKKIKQKMFSAFGSKQEKRVYKEKEINPHIKKMNPIALEMFRKNLQRKAYFKRLLFWLSLFGLLSLAFIFLVVKMS